MCAAWQVWLVSLLAVLPFISMTSTCLSCHQHDPYLPATWSPACVQPGKLVALKDASPDTLARLEEAAAEALGPGGWDAKARKKAAAAKAGGARPAAGAGDSAAAAGGYGR
jgi:hypothetical protein